MRAFVIFIDISFYSVVSPQVMIFLPSDYALGSCYTETQVFRTVSSTFLVIISSRQRGFALTGRLQAGILYINSNEEKRLFVTPRRTHYII